MNTKYLKRLVPDLRALIMIIPALIIMALIDLAVVKTLLFSVCGIVLLIGFMHWLRKLALPYFEWHEFSESAKGHPMAAAVVILAVSILFSSLVLATVLWVRG